MEAKNDEQLNPADFENETPTDFVSLSEMSPAEAANYWRRMGEEVQRKKIKKHEQV